MNTVNKYILRWQYGVLNDEIKLHYTYGSIDTLRVWRYLKCPI